MKLNALLAPIIVIILFACNNNKPKEKPATGKDTTTATVATDQKQKAIADNEKLLEDLSKMSPLTAEHLKALMAETVMGAKLSNYSASSTLGASVATGEYKLNDTASITLIVYDCAGAGGAGLYNLQFAGLLDYNNDNENEYTKVLDFNGGKAIEHCMKTSVECSLTYFSGGRFLVALEGNNVGADALRQLAKGLNIK